MYRIIIATIICMACNSNGNLPQQHATANLLSFYKDKVNPLLQNLETTAAKRKLDSILPLAKERDNYVEMCSWLRCMAVVYQLENKPDSARLYVNQALQLAMEKDTTERQILAGKIQTAGVLSECNSLDSALQYAREAYSIAKRIDTPGLPFICLKLYDIYEKIGDLDMQKKYLFEGFNRSTSPKHKTVFATNISAYYERVNQVDSALIFFRALMKDSSFSNPYYDAVRYENLGTLLSKKGFLTEGLHYQLKGMQISRDLGEPDAQSYYNIAATYRRLTQYNKDEYLLDTALRLAAHESNWALLKKIWRAKAENLRYQKRLLPAYAAQDSAFGYYQKEVDSSIIGRAKELEAKYNLLDKDNQIKSLALSNQESERIRERQRSVIRRIIYIATLLSVILFLVWRIKQDRMNRREGNLRQQLLRGQINSHLLYGCVSGLQVLIENRNREAAIDFVKQLAQLLRLTLENSRQPFVPFKNELVALTCYLKMQQVLLPNQFDYHIEVEGIANQRAILIPPMLLQPFIENSIVHGFSELTGKGQLNIRIKKDQTTLHCVIEDNGRGFQSVDDPSRKRPLSTLINRERLEILSRQTKTRAQLHIIDKKMTTGEDGVRVEIIVPFK